MSGPHSEEGYKLMGAAFEVYNEIGYGMAEEMTEHLSALIFANLELCKKKTMKLLLPFFSSPVEEGRLKYGRYFCANPQAVVTSSS